MDGLAKIILILQALMGNGGEEQKTPHADTHQIIACESFSSTSRHKRIVNGEVIVDEQTASAGQAPCIRRAFGGDAI